MAHEHDEECFYVDEHELPYDAFALAEGHEAEYEKKVKAWDRVKYAGSVVANVVLMAAMLAWVFAVVATLVLGGYLIARMIVG